MSSSVTTAVIYSLIAFSIVFIVLGGLTVVIYAMRLLASDGESNNVGTGPTAKAVTAAKIEPASTEPVESVATNVKAQHVAAITAAILAMTGGGGRILSVMPVGNAAPTAKNTIHRWRSAGIVEATASGIAPAWKR